MKRAIVTMTDPKFVRGTIAMVYSARFYGYTGDIVAMYTEPLTKIDLKVLKHLKVKPIKCKYISNPNDKKRGDTKIRNRFLNSSIYGKLNTWSLTDYDLVLFVDSDIIFLQEFVSVFDTPFDKNWIAASEIPVGPAWYWPNRVNTGVFLAVPDNTIYDDMISKLKDTYSYDCSDQGFLCTYFKDRKIYLSRDMNTDRYATKEEIRTARALHYLNLPKPWEGTPERHAPCEEKLRIPKHLYTLWWKCYNQATREIPEDLLAEFEESKNNLHSVNRI